MVTGTNALRMQRSGNASENTHFHYKLAENAVFSCIYQKNVVSLQPKRRKDLLKSMSKQENDRLYFVSFCIEQYKQHAGISGEQAAELLFRSGIAEYLNDHFEVLHTQSRQWLMEEIDNRLAVFGNHE